MGGLLPRQTSFITDILNKITTNYDGDLNSIKIPSNKLYLFRLSSSCTNGPDVGTKVVFTSAINHYCSRGASGSLLLCHKSSDKHVGGLIKINRLDYSQVFQCPYATDVSYTKMFNVNYSGLVVLNAVVGSYSDQDSYVAIIKIFPSTTKEKVQVTYFPETTNKYFKYVIEDNKSITLYSKNIRSYKTGFSIISYDQINSIYNQFVESESMPSTAIDV